MSFPNLNQDNLPPSSNLAKSILDKINKRRNYSISPYSSFSDVNEAGNTPLHYYLLFNQSMDDKLTAEEFDYLLTNSNLKKLNRYQQSPLLLLAKVPDHTITVTDQQFAYLLSASNPFATDNDGLAFLQYYFKNISEKKFSFNLQPHQLTYLIKNDSNPYSIFYYAFAREKLKKDFISEEQIITLINKSHDLFLKDNQYFAYNNQAVYQNLLDMLNTKLTISCLAQPTSSQNLKL